MLLAQYGQAREVARHSFPEPAWSPALVWTSTGQLRVLQERSEGTHSGSGWHYSKGAMQIHRLRLSDCFSK